MDVGISLNNRIFTYGEDDFQMPVLTSNAILNGTSIT